MIRAHESVSKTRHRRRLLVLVLMVSLGLPNAATAVDDKTPIHRELPAESAHQTFSRSSSSGTTLVFLGLLLAGAILARRVIQRRRNQRFECWPKGSIELLSRQRIDEELTVRVLRVGQKVLVVGASHQGLATLGEISDPGEVATITGKETSLNETSLNTAARASTPFNGRFAIGPAVPSNPEG